MLTQPLLDKLTQLRLPAFRAALEEQLHNPQYADLPFEDRLGLLVDRECIRRDNNRLQRRLRQARLPLPATNELPRGKPRGIRTMAIAEHGSVHTALPDLVSAHSDGFALHRHTAQRCQCNSRLTRTLHPTTAFSPWALV